MNAKEPSTAMCYRVLNGDVADEELLELVDLLDRLD